MAEAFYLLIHFKSIWPYWWDHYQSLCQINPTFMLEHFGVLWVPHLPVGICLLSFPMWFEIFLVLHMQCNFGLYFGHFECCVIPYYILSIPYGEYWCFCFSRQSTWLGLGCIFWTVFYEILHRSLTQVLSILLHHTDT